MNKCVECGNYVEWNRRSHICEECLEVNLRIKIRNPDRVVEDPHHSWF